ncbi:MAG: hypothetical protein ABSA53_36205 [Streptosporangiaceae bacterium]
MKQLRTHITRYGTTPDGRIVLAARAALGIQDTDTDPGNEDDTEQDS